MSAATILVTGATGTTGSRVVAQLRALGHKVRCASRSGQGPGSFRFDWTDPKTYGPAADGVDAAYLLAPIGVVDLLPAMQPFIDRLLERETRLVLLSSSSLEAGGPLMGEVHAYLSAHAAHWTVLRPSWFMQNFSGAHSGAIRDEGVIYSATGSGRVGFISADDIAAVAVRALTDPAMPNGDLILTGPQALSYDDVASILGARLGRTITHRHLTVEALAARHEAQGIPAEFSRMLAGLDASIAGGAEDRVTGEVERLTERRSEDFAHFAARAGDAWLSPDRQNAGSSILSRP